MHETHRRLQIFGAALALTVLPFKSGLADPIFNPKPVQIAAAGSGTGGSSAIYEVDMEYAAELNAHGGFGTKPKSIELQTGGLPAGWNAPSPNGHERLHGSLDLGQDRRINFVLDRQDEVESTLRVTFNGDLDFTSKPVRTSVRGGFADPITVAPAVRGGRQESCALSFYYPAEFAKKQGRHPLTYYTASGRKGTLSTPSGVTTLSLIDDSGACDYTPQKYAWQGPRLSVGPNLKAEGVQAGFHVGTERYTVEAISASGDKLKARRAALGEFRGRVTSAKDGTPVTGATVSLPPSGPSVKTNQNGEFVLQAPEGQYPNLLAKAEGFVPNYSWSIDSSAGGAAVRLARIDLALRSGSVVLKDRTSYHFLSGERYELTGGDFYFGFADKGPSFFANNRMQGGLVDLGDLGQVALDEVKVPEHAQYVIFGVPAVVGHVYVSKARAGEEGHFIAFRVTRIELGNEIELKYRYF